MIYEIRTYGLTEADGLWPPTGGAEMLLAQANKIVMPSAFSPMQ